MGLVRSGIELERRRDLERELKRENSTLTKMEKSDVRKTGKSSMYEAERMLPKVRTTHSIRSKNGTPDGFFFKIEVGKSPITRSEPRLNVVTSFKENPSRFLFETRIKNAFVPKRTLPLVRVFKETAKGSVRFASDTD